MSNAIWIIILRYHDSEVFASGVMSLREMVDDAWKMTLRMRYNLDIRLVTMRLPPNTRREQVMQAFDLLAKEERLKLFNLPTFNIGVRVFPSSARKPSPLTV